MAQLSELGLNLDLLGSHGGASAMPNKPPACEAEGHSSAVCLPEEDPSSKLLLPEQLCVQALSTQVKSAKQSLRKHRRSGSARLAHAYLEQAIATSRFEAEEKHKLIDSASLSLDLAENDPRLPARLQIEADILRAYWPALTDRALNKPLTPDVMSLTYRGLAKVLHEYPKKYQEDDQRFADTIGLCVQAEIAALLVRTGSTSYFPWPAAFREEEGIPRQLNHDLYLIQASQFSKSRPKVPIQVKLHNPDGQRQAAYDTNRIMVMFYDQLGFSVDEAAFKAIAPIETSYDPLDKYDHLDTEVWRLGYTRPQITPSDLDKSVTGRVHSPMLHEITKAIITEANYGVVIDQSFYRLERISATLRAMVSDWITESTT